MGWYSHCNQDVDPRGLAVAVFFIPAVVFSLFLVSAVYVYSPAGQEAKQRSLEKLVLKKCIRSQFALRDFTLEQLERKGWAEKVVTDYCKAKTVQ